MATGRGALRRVYVLLLTVMLADVGCGVLMSPDLRVRPSSVPAAEAQVTSRLPSVRLSATEALRLDVDGEVQRQTRRGRGGECLQVVETALSPAECWERIADVANWSGLMRGVKASRVIEERRDGVVRASFSVTKLRLPCALLLKEDTCAPAAPDMRVLDFSLDPESPRVAVNRCSGRWTVETVKGGLTRVSLAAEIQATRFVPEKIVDYVAARALTRATAWVPRSKGAGASD